MPLLKMKSKKLIREVLDKYEDTKLNIASEVARDMLTEEIHASLSKHFHLFRKNELIVKENEKAD